jgi:nucleotide-binding universal stress UspA family protein
MARTRAVRPFRRILHPSDFSPASRPAFSKALQLAKASGAQLLVAHVLPVLPLLPDAYIAATTYDELLRGQRASGRRQLDRLVRKARAAGVRATGILLDFGVPAERLTQLAKSRRADVIVMGTHGRTGLTRALLGSVAARVVATATCPVLTVRA